MPFFERGYVQDVVTLETIQFNFFDPPQRSGGDAEWVETQIRLRSQPHHTYVNTSSIVYALTGKIVASMEQGDNRTGVDVRKDIDFLQSLEYPEYVETQGIVRPPHRCRLWLKGSLNGIGYMRGLTVNYTDVTGVDEEHLVVDVSFNFVVVNPLPPSFEQVRRGDILV